MKLDALVDALLPTDSARVAPGAVSYASITAVGDGEVSAQFPGSASTITIRLFARSVSFAAVVVGDVAVIGRLSGQWLLLDTIGLIDLPEDDAPARPAAPTVVVSVARLMTVTAPVGGLTWRVHFQRGDEQSANYHSSTWQVPATLSYSATLPGLALSWIVHVQVRSADLRESEWSLATTVVVPEAAASFEVSVNASAMEAGAPPPAGTPTKGASFEVSVNASAMEAGAPPPAGTPTKGASFEVSVNASAMEAGAPPPAGTPTKGASFEVSVNASAMEAGAPPPAGTPTKGASFEVSVNASAMEAGAPLVP